MTPSSTAKRPLSSGVTQPEKSLPLNRGLKASSASSSAAGETCIRAVRARHAARPMVRRFIAVLPG
jgi:shikimate kinase